MEVKSIKYKLFINFILNYYILKGAAILIIVAPNFYIIYFIFLE